MKINMSAAVSCIGVVIAGAMLNGALAAEIYTWTGPDGRTHFGDRPPAAGAEAIEFRQTEPPPAPADADERRQAQQKLLDLYRQEREDKAAAAQKAGAARAERLQECAEARSQLARYQNASALYRRDPDGKRHALGWGEREQLTAEARERVSRWCAGQ
jgi:hypothetical protein